MEWLINHWAEIAKVIGEFTAAMGVLSAAIVGLASAIVHFTGTLSADHPMLPTIKFLAKVALNTPTPDDADRPPSGGTSTTITGGTNA